VENPVELEILIGKSQFPISFHRRVPVESRLQGGSLMTIWQIYEQRKRQLKALGLPADEYSRRLKLIAKELGI
jgi:hypothetical protein